MTEKKHEIFYQTWFELGMPTDRLIWRISLAFQSHKMNPLSPLEHRFIIRKFKGQQYAYKAYKDYMIFELKRVHMCSRCGGTGAYGYTNRTCYGCGGDGWLNKENHKFSA